MFIKTTKKTLKTQEHYQILRYEAVVVIFLYTDKKQITNRIPCGNSKKVKAPQKCCHVTFNSPHPPSITNNYTHITQSPVGKGRVFSSLPCPHFFSTCLISVFPFGKETTLRREMWSCRGQRSSVLSCQQIMCH